MEFQQDKHSLLFKRKCFQIFFFFLLIAWKGSCQVKTGGQQSKEA
jgi:hypothetical protein